MNKYLSLIKFSHTIFALPFALLGYVLGVFRYAQSPDWRILVGVILSMVFARSAAMAFNRYLDRDIDAKNERTASREIPAGKIAARNALIFVVINSALFVATTWFINPLVFALSPVALLVILGYSYTKRFTALCHFVLGAGLALAPIGAYLAVTSRFDWIPLFYSFAVFFWVAGFDIIYAMQDVDFDKAHNLKSMVVFMGKKEGLKLSTVVHALSAGFIFVAAYALSVQYAEINWLSWMGAIIFIGLLFYQHTLVKPDDLKKVNLAFFTTNGIASLVFCGMVILDFFV